MLVVDTTPVVDEDANQLNGDADCGNLDKNHMYLSCTNKQVNGLLLGLEQVGKVPAVAISKVWKSYHESKENNKINLMKKKTGKKPRKSKEKGRKWYHEATKARGKEAERDQEE